MSAVSAARMLGVGSTKLYNVRDLIFTKGRNFILMCFYEEAVLYRVIQTQCLDHSYNDV